MAKVTGIGGVFFKSKGKGAELSAWYEKNLGDGGMTVWNAADSDTKWFGPSESSFMINYRVDNMDQLLEQLKANGVEIIKGPDTDFNGKFAWIMDPDGNKVELWEPMVADENDKE